jgi:hypothetical protein
VGHFGPEGCFTAAREDAGDGEWIERYARRLVGETNSVEGVADDGAVEAFADL